jgi:molybdopterin-guanine dinucleotide biosynthesis protein B
MASVDLVLVVGFKDHPHPKIEVHRPELGKPPLWPGRPDIAAVASGMPQPQCPRPVLPLDNPAEIAAWIVRFASARGGASADETGAS